MSQPPELPSNDPKSPFASGGQMDPAQQFTPGGAQPMSGSEAFDQGSPPPGGRRFSFNRIGLIAVIGAIALAYFTFQQYKLSAKSKADPTPMTLADLMTNGPGDNLYLELQDVYLLDQPAVIESREGNEASWTKIWIDATPSGADRAPTAKPPGARNVVILFDDVSNEMEYQQRCVEANYTGMVMNEIRSLDEETADLLAQDIPGFDRESTFIFEAGATPSTAGFLFLLAGLAVVCLVVAGFAFFPKS